MLQASLRVPVKRRKKKKKQDVNFGGLDITVEESVEISGSLKLLINLFQPQMIIVVRFIWFLSLWWMIQEKTAVPDVNAQMFFLI